MPGFTAFTASKLLRLNQQGRGKGKIIHPPRLGLANNRYKLKLPDNLKASWKFKTSIY